MNALRVCFGMLLWCDIWVGFGFGFCFAVCWLFKLIGRLVRVWRFGGFWMSGGFECVVVYGWL